MPSIGAAGEASLYTFISSDPKIPRRGASVVVPQNQRAGPKVLLTHRDSPVRPPGWEARLGRDRLGPAPPREEPAPGLRLLKGGRRVGSQDRKMAHLPAERRVALPIEVQLDVRVAEQVRDALELVAGPASEDVDHHGRSDQPRLDPP